MLKMVKYIFCLKQKKNENVPALQYNEILII